MQKFITKYGLAAHLGLLTVAPLFLFALDDPASGPTCVLWMSALASWWMMLSPSKRVGEPLHVARARVAFEMARDPFAWAFAALLVFLSLRWANSGLELTYDPESGAWSLSGALNAFFPSGLAGTGYGIFAIFVSIGVVVVAVRHSLGRAARAAYLLSVSSFAGAAGILAAVRLARCSAQLKSLALCPYETASFAGVAFAVCVLMGIVAFAEAIARPSWHWLMPLAAGLVGGSITGAILFSPAAFLALLAVLVFVTVVFSLVTAGREAGASATFRGVIVFAFALIVPVLFIGCWSPVDLLSSRFEPLSDGQIFPQGYGAVRDILAGVASRAWQEHPWIGTGVGTFGVDIHLLASEADREMLSPLQTGLPFGWWRLLAEQGLLGALALAIPTVSLLASYVWRGVVSWGKQPLSPTVILMPVLLVLVGVSGLMDESVLRPDVLSALGAGLVVSACAFPALRRSDGVQTIKEEGIG